MKKELDIETTVNDIINLFEDYGSEDYIGEAVSQIEHMCQCAQLAEEAGADEETIIAALLHDIGHLCELASPDNALSHMDEYGVVDHEKLGGAYLLSKGFSVNVAKMVASHVEAKRYLVYKFPAYYDLLSDASKNTLSHQGGVMAESEAAIFESDPLCDKYVELRLWDERAKAQNKPLPSLEYYKELLTKHLSSQKTQVTIA